MSGKCRFFHSWTKWEEADHLYYNHYYSGNVITEVEKKRCRKCGKIKRRGTLAEYEPR